MRKTLIVGVTLALMCGSALAQNSGSACPAEVLEIERSTLKVQTIPALPSLALTALPKVKPSPASKPVVIRMSPS